MRVSAYDVREALRPFLGSALAENMELCNRVADVMRGFVPNTDSLSDLKDSLQDVLFNAVYDASGERMLVTRDDGTVARIYMKDLPALTDDALGAMFAGMPVYSASFQMLKELALREGSLSAMRVLYEKYDRFMNEEEKETLVRVIRGYPAWRYSSWLNKQPTQEENE